MRRRAATCTEAAAATAETAPARRAARVLHEALVEGLLERVRDVRRVDVVFFVLIVERARLLDRLGGARTHRLLRAASPAIVRSVRPSLAFVALLPLLPLLSLLPLLPLLLVAVVVVAPALAIERAKFSLLK